MSSQPPPAVRRWPLQKYTQIAYRQTPEKSYVARTHGELSFELNLNSKTLVVKQGFCVTEEVALLADRLPDVYSKDTRLMFSLKEPFTNNTFRKFRVSFYSAADFQSFSDSLSHFLAIRMASKSSMSCVTPCFSAQKFPQPYDEVSTPVNTSISRNLLDGFAFPTPSYTQRTPQTQGSSSSTSQYAPYLQSGNSQQDTNSQLFENPQRYLSQQHTTSQPQFRPLLMESSPVSSQQRFPQEQMERGSVAQFYNPHASQQDFVGPQFGAPAPTGLSRTPSQHSSRLKAPPNHISHEEPFVTPPTSNQQSQYSQWDSAMPHMIPSAQQSQEYPARDSASARSFKTATNASSAYSDFLCPTSTSRFDEQMTHGRLTTHPPVAAEGTMSHGLQTDASYGGRDLLRGPTSAGTNTFIDDHRTAHFLPSARAMDAPRFDTQLRQPDSQMPHPSIQRNSYPSWQNGAGQHDRYRPTAASNSSSSRDLATYPAVAQTAVTPASETSMAPSERISGSRLQDLHQPSMQDSSHIPNREVGRANMSGWLAGNGDTQAPAADRSEWVVPAAPSNASSTPSCSSAGVTTHSVTSFAAYEPLATTSQTGLAPANSVPMFNEEWQLQRLAQATVADTGSGSDGTFSADPTTARAAELVPGVAYYETAELPRPQPLRPSQSPLLVALSQSSWLGTPASSNHSSSLVPHSLMPVESKQYSVTGVRSSNIVASIKREVDEVARFPNANENGQSSAPNFGEFRGYEKATSSSFTATIKQKRMDGSSLGRPPQHKALLRLKTGKVSSRKTVAGGRQRKPLGEIQANVQPLSSRAPDQPLISPALNKPIKQTASVPHNKNPSCVRRRKRDSFELGSDQSTQTDSTGGIASLAEDPAYVRELLANVLQSEYAGRLFQAIDDIVAEMDVEPANVDTSSLRSAVADADAAHSNDFVDDQRRTPLGSVAMYDNTELRKES